MSWCSLLFSEKALSAYVVHPHTIPWLSIFCAKIYFCVSKSVVEKSGKFVIVMKYYLVRCLINVNIYFLCINLTVGNNLPQLFCSKRRYIHAEHESLTRNLWPLKSLGWTFLRLLLISPDSVHTGCCWCLTATCERKIKIIFQRRSGPMKSNSNLFIILGLRYTFFQNLYYLNLDNFSLKFRESLTHQTR